MTDTFDVRCPNCGQPFAATVDAPRRAVGCLKCGERFIVDPPGGPPPGGYDPYEFPSTSRAAVASVVFGALPFVWPIAPIAAIVCGIVGLDASAMPKVRGKGMALSGFLLGLAALVIGPGAFVCVLMTYRAHERANREKCVANMTEIWHDISQFRDLNNHAMPPSLASLARELELPPELFVCPGSDDVAARSIEQMQSPGHCSYKYFGRGEVQPGPKDLILAEGDDNHGDGVNLLFGDGHVRLVSPAEAKPLIEKAKSDQARRDKG